MDAVLFDRLHGLFVFEWRFRLALDRPKDEAEQRKQHNDGQSSQTQKAIAKGEVTIAFTIIRVR